MFQYLFVVLVALVPHSGWAAPAEEGERSYPVDPSSMVSLRVIASFSGDAESIEENPRMEIFHQLGQTSPELPSRRICLLEQVRLERVGDEHAIEAGDKASSDTALTRILFGSCIQQDRPTPIFPVMLRADAQLLLFLGDNIYADTSDIDVMRAKYSTLASNDGFKALISDRPVMATWDDHDYGLNDGGATYPERDAAQQAFLDFWGTPADSPRRQRPGVYEAKTFGPPGKRLQVIMLDTRYFRSPLKKGPAQVGGPYLPDNNPEKTMLGGAQWKWLEEQLRRPANLRVIASGIQVIAEAAGQETWANLPHEQTRLFDLIRSTAAGGVIFVSGDRHWAEMSLASEGVAYPLLDVTSSSFNQKHERGTPTRNRFRAIKKTFHEENFGVISIDWGVSDPMVTIEVRDLAGKTQLEKSLRLSDLR